ALQHLVEQAERAAVNVLHVDDVVARVEEQHERRLGAQPRRKREAMFGVLQRGQALLERVAGRVAGARVLETLVLAHALLSKRGRHVNGLDHRPRGGIRPLPYMQSASGEPPVRWKLHLPTMWGGRRRSRRVG